jgi:hypothetical protein
MTRNAGGRGYLHVAWAILGALVVGSMLLATFGGPP